MRKISLIAFAVVASCIFASCSFLHSLAETPVDVQDDGTNVPQDPNGSPDSATTGVIYIDILVGLLAALGLAPAARILALAKPAILPVIRVLLGLKKAQADATAPEQK